MIDELKKLRALTETLTGNGYLRDQAEEWEYALDAIPDYVYVINNKFQIKFVNRLLAERLGKEKSELYNKICYKIIDREEIEEPPSSWKVTVTRDKPHVIENIYLRNMNGWFTMTRSPIYTKANKLLGFICVLQDVTEKRKALKDLIAREATLETIFNAAPIGIGMITRKDRIFLSVNKFFTDLLGYQEEELIGKSVRTVYSSDEEFKRVGKIKHEEIDRHGTGSIETKFITKNGKLLDIFLRTSVLASDPSKLVFTVTDITNRKKREKQLKLNEDRLESALRLSSMESYEQEEIIEYALEEAVRLTDSKIGYIHFVEEPGADLSEVQLSLFMWSSGVHKNCTAEKTIHYPLIEAGCWADCVRVKKPVVHNDYQSLTAEQGKKGLPEGHILLTRHMSVPVMEEGRVVAVAGVGNKDTDYNKSDIRQLNLFMNSMWDIVKRKQAESLARKSKEYFERLINSTPMGVFVYKLKGDDLILTHFNPAAQRILKMNAIDHLGKEITEIFPKLNDKGLVDTYKKIASKGGKPFQNNEYSYSDDKVSGIFSVFAFQSELNEIAVFFTDITEQSLVEGRLKESEQKYRLIAENVLDAIWTIDTHLNFTYINPSIKDLMGFEPEEWIGHNISEFATKEDFAYMAQKVGESLADPNFNDVTFETKMLNKEGVNVPIEINAKALRDEKGNLIGFQGRTRVLN
jgi:PAS domain S-box-containing protein